MAAVAGGSHLCVTENCTALATHGTSCDACPTLPLSPCISLTPTGCIQTR